MFVRDWPMATLQLLETHSLKGHKHRHWERDRDRKTQTQTERQRQTETETERQRQDIETAKDETDRSGDKQT